MLKSLEKVVLPPGRYLLAVSGGVDSMVLLDLLARQPGIEPVVAHFDHGIRQDSAADAQLVRRRARQLGAEFVLGHGRLGPNTSEAKARAARYDFLRRQMRKSGSRAIVTAHHQDDLVETAVINVLRGSGRRGLSAMLANPEVKRPLLEVSKSNILEYAQKHHLVWHEDATNSDDRYLRNYLRLNVLPKLSVGQRQTILKNINKVANNQQESDSLIATISHLTLRGKNIDRNAYAALPASVADELMLFWLRSNKVADIDRRTVNRLSLGLKTAKDGAKIDAAKGLTLEITAKNAHFSNR